MKLLSLWNINLIYDFLTCFPNMTCCFNLTDFVNLRSSFQGQRMRKSKELAVCFKKKKKKVSLITRFSLVQTTELMMF